MSSNFSADSHPPGGVGRGLTSVDCEDIGITKIYTMNIRGLTDDKERTLVRRMQLLQGKDQWMGGSTAGHLTTQNSYKLLCKTDTNTMEAIRKNRGARNQLIN